MNTTILFVELIVIGVSAIIWPILLVFSIFGYAWVPVVGLQSAIAAIPIIHLTDNSCRPTIYHIIGPSVGLEPASSREVSHSTEHAGICNINGIIVTINKIQRTANLTW